MASATPPRVCAVCGKNDDGTIRRCCGRIGTCSKDLCVDCYMAGNCESSKAGEGS